MPKFASCKDTGLNCEFIIRAETEEKLLENANEHANAAHPTRVAQSEYKGLTSFAGGLGMTDFIGADARRDWLAKVSEVAQDE